MNGIQGHNSPLHCYTETETTWANEMYYGVNHAPGAGLITRPVDLQSGAIIELLLPL